MNESTPITNEQALGLVLLELSGEREHAAESEARERAQALTRRAAGNQSSRAIRSGTT